MSTDRNSPEITTSIKNCGNCIFFNGDETDERQFCDEREEYVSNGYYCFRFKVKNSFWEFKKGYAYHMHNLFLLIRLY